MGQSMKHVRKRLSTEQHILNSYNNHHQHLPLQSLQSKYDNNSNNDIITKNDVHNAISYDVTKNEYYIKQLKKYMTILIDNHEYIYRIYDDVMEIYDSYISLLYNSNALNDNNDNYNDDVDNDNNAM